MASPSHYKNYEIKLQKVLNQLLNPEYKIENDSYLDILLSQIAGKYDAELGAYLLKLPIITEWIEKALTTWENSSNLPSNGVQSFMLNLTAIISTNEIQFIKLDLLDLYIKLFYIFKIQNHSSTTSSVKFGYVKLLNSLTEHESGLKWIFKTERWKDIIHYATNEYTIYVTRESQLFFLKLLTQVPSNPEKYEKSCNVVVNEIIAPILNISLTQQTSPTLEIRDEEIQEILLPSLGLIHTIIDTTFKADGNFAQRKFVAKLFASKKDLDKSIISLYRLTCSQKCYSILSNTLVQIYFAELNAVNKELITVDVVKDFFVKLFAMVTSIGKKYGITGYSSGVALGHIYWIKLFTNKMVDLNVITGEYKTCYQNQLVVIQILPIMYILGKFSKGKRGLDDIGETYINKIFKISCQNTIRLCYSLRTIFEDEPPELFNIAIEGIRIVMENRKNYDRDRIVIVFQSLMLALTEIVSFLNENNLPSYYTEDQNGILTHILDSLGKLITDFTITWRESVETIRLQNLATDLLKCPTLSPKIAVLSLKLIQLSIEHFLPPNLALLVDEVNGGKPYDIGPILYQRLHDINWEVRDSALEVIHAIVIISEFKYPAFQQFIIDSQLCSLCVNVAIHDTESYVRGMALKCLTMMVQIDSYWKTVLEKEQLPEKMIHIIHNETEGVVRREGAALMAELYDNHRINPELMPQIYITMSSATISDFHWEVKVKGLKFWKKVICKTLTDQGMIDGSFPNVTFSKEKRKIVALTESEILSRINKSLTFLSDVNCLTVLMACLFDNYDISVVDTAVEIIERIEALLEKYNILNFNIPEVDVEEDQTMMNGNNKSKKESTLEYGEINDAIDSIVNMDDINLLANVYQNQLRMQDEESMAVDNPEGVKKVTPEEFVGLLSKKRAKAVADERNRWLQHCRNNLESLLDDILKTYEDCNINNLDCY